jgi:hypothetical protein
MPPSNQGIVGHQRIGVSDIPPRPPSPTNSPSQTGQVGENVTRHKAGGWHKLISRNRPAAASHPCHKLRRRSGRRCLCRPTSRMALATSRPPFLPPPRPLRPLRSTNLPDRPLVCAHHAEQPLLCALLTPFPRSPLAFPKIHVILPVSPGPPSLAARLWRSFDGGVGKERTSKAIASPRAQERIEPVACHQKVSRLSLNPHPTRGSPARSFEPQRKVFQEIRSKRFGVGRELPKSMPERIIAKGQLPPKE